MRPAPDYWYAAKRYGWGWGMPVAWQGWAVLAVFMVAIIVPAHWLRHTGYRWAYPAYVVALVLVQSWICYLKGPPPRWRWGEPDR
ncbi:MAG: hypothetical protein JSS29_13845 [Proteobacteria bacterium]|nr:hypothetical protein [Pseudomonadota bacterium]